MLTIVATERPWWAQAVQIMDYNTKHVLYSAVTTAEALTKRLQNIFKMLSLLLTFYMLEYESILLWMYVIVTS